MLLFAVILLWLMLRKEATLPAGDLAGVSLACWAAARMLTENLRLRQIAALPEDFRIAGWAAAAAMALILILWMGRAFRQQKNTGYAFACLPVFVLSVAGIVLIQNGILTGYTPAVDVIAQVCLALLALKAVLCMGRVTRKERLKSPAADTCWGMVCPMLAPQTMGEAADGRLTSFK